MKLHTAQSWNEMLLRVLQSCADTASWMTPIRLNDDRCHCMENACSRSDLVQLAEASDDTVQTWHQWMRCELAYLLTELKLTVQDEARVRSHCGATVFDYFHGSGSIPPLERDQATREAIEIMEVNTQLFYIWIQNELSDLGARPRKVYKRLLSDG